MTDTRDILRRGVGNFEPGADGYEQVIGRLERKRRNQRIMARALAVAVILIVSLAFLAAIRSDPPADDGPPPGIVPSNGKIAYSDRAADPMKPQIIVINADGSGRVRLTSGYFPVWSPDGSRIAFTRRGGLFIMNADGSGDTLVQGQIPGRGSIYQPSWSPDGSHLVFGTALTGRGASYEVYVVNVDGSGLAKISGDHTQDFWPSWSPDGTLIAFRTGTRHQLATMRPDGSNRTTVVSSHIDYPTWSPDGQIQFLQLSGGGLDVFRINTDGTGLIQLTYSPEIPELFPVSSGDGTQIAYRSRVDGQRAIFTVSIGSEGSPVLVTETTYTEESQSWQPT